MGKIIKRVMRKVSPTVKEQSTCISSQIKDQKEPLPTNLQQVIQTVRVDLGNSSDLVIRELIVQKRNKVALFYIDGLTDSTIVQEIVDSLIDIKENYEQGGHSLIEMYKNSHTAIGEVGYITDFQSLFQSILSGDSVFFMDGQNKGLFFGTKGWESRAVEEPTTQTVVRGPKEAFIENLRTNTALVRRRIKSSQLWIESLVVGEQSKTSIAIMYMNGIVNPEIVEEILERLKRINVDGAMESGIIEELIEDTPYSPFPTIYTTERPDTVAASLLEGKVAIIVDGTPFVLLAPAFFVQFFQVSEDYYDKLQIATFTRLLRFICFFISIGFLSLYIAIVTFHQEAIPTPLLNSIAAQREGVPFPAFVEAIFLMGSFEVLREAGVRMPRVIGPAISIVGGLVLGQAAVEAGFVSAAMVIIVAITALSDFVIPSASMSDAIKINRYLLLLLAASFGIYGLALGLLLITLHLCSLRSFGIPYMSPLGPFILSDQKDALIRLPKWMQHLRPYLLGQQNLVREQTPPPKPEERS